MGSLGDFHSGCRIFDMFTLTDTLGRPSVLGGNPAPTLVCYRNAFESCSTAGITLAINCNGLLGVHGWEINTNSDPAFYACGNQYQVLLRNGCVTTSLTTAYPEDSVCVSGYVIGRFSLNYSAPLRPLIHGRNAVDVDASGRVLTQPCSTIFSAWRLVDRPVIDACSTIFTVQKVIDRPIADACSTIFSVQRVVDADSILNTAIAEPSGVFTWPATWRGILQWLGAVASNKIVQEAGQQGVCDRAGAVTLGKANTTDDGTSATRGSFA